MLQYDRKKLGEHLREVRERANFTQAQVSTKLGYSSPQFISNLERGVSAAPLKTLSRMIKLYKSDPDVMSEILLQSQRRLLLTKLKGKR